MKKKTLKKIATEIATLEREIQLNINVDCNEQKIIEIMSSLTLDEMIEIDDYIFQNKLLNK